MLTSFIESPFFEPPKRKPYIRLRGRWLDSLGFDIGARLSVETAPGSIILTVVERPVVVPPKIPRKLQRQAR
jgi:hypothetical protein